MNGILRVRPGAWSVSHWILPPMASWEPAIDAVLFDEVIQRCETALPAIVCTCGRCLIDQR